MKKNMSSQKGFTLIEMIVSLALFTVVAVIAVGALLKLMDTERKSVTLKTSIDNMSFALESMSREMRVGRNYYCIPNDLSNIPIPTHLIAGNSNLCPTGLTNSWIVAFTSTKPCLNDLNNSVVYAYRFKAGITGTNGTLEKAQQVPDCSVPVGEANFQEVISDDIDITDSQVDIQLVGRPKLFFYFKGFTGVKSKEKSSFSLQTSVSQRIP
jgi:prepilin-type N-terminal cleavage/methylation domain-containing protein